MQNKVYLINFVQFWILYSEIFFLANIPYFNFQINFQSSHLTKKKIEDASKRLSSYCVGALNCKYVLIDLQNFTMNYIASLGAARSKLLMGVPFYGQTYRLVRNEWHKLGDPVSGAGAPGEFTKQPGMLAYYEICNRIKRQNWKVGRGPTAYHEDQLVAYENTESIDEKGRWIIENGFGGATAWTVDLDDFSNRCCMGIFPLLRSLNFALGMVKTKCVIKYCL